MKLAPKHKVKVMYIELNFRYKVRDFHVIISTKINPPFIEFSLLLH